MNVNQQITISNDIFRPKYCSFQNIFVSFLHFKSILITMVKKLIYGSINDDIKIAYTFRSKLSV